MVDIIRVQGTFAWRARTQREWRGLAQVRSVAAPGQKRGSHSETEPSMWPTARIQPSQHQSGPDAHHAQAQGQAGPRRSAQGQAEPGQDQAD